METASVPAPSPSSDDTAAATAIPPAPRLAPVHPLSPPPPPPVPAADHEDSLNLLSLAGPVIAKRVAPVAGAVAGVVVITWLIRRVRRRNAVLNHRGPRSRVTWGSGGARASQGGCWRDSRDSK